MTTPVALGIDVGGTKLVAGTVAADGTIVERRRRTTPAGDAEGFVDVLAELIGDVGAGLPVGIGVAGLVTPRGEVVYGPNIAVRDVPVAALLRERIGREVSVVNDASAAALGEQRAGAGKGAAHVAMFTLGTGVGGGIVLDGVLLRGTNGYAGELGHIIVEEGGRPCPCGNLGCIEAYASGTAIGRIARDHVADHPAGTALRGVEELTGRAVSDAAAAGDEVAIDVLTQVGGWLGVAMASLVNALDPDLVIVGGGAATSNGPWVVPAAAASMRARLLGAGHREPPEVRMAALGDDAGMVGAAMLALDAPAVHTPGLGT